MSKRAKQNFFQLCPTLVPLRNRALCLWIARLLWHVWCLVKALLWVADSQLCPHVVERGKRSLGSLFYRHQSHLWGLHYHLLKSHLPWALHFQHRNLRRIQTFQPQQLKSQMKTSAIQGSSDFISKVVGIEGLYVSKSHEQKDVSAGQG